ncbi:MAG: transposase Tn3 family protein [Actinoallomurus sp.]|nr:transposase Tn3 family protein [Actinoallomurus sp.]
MVGNWTLVGDELALLSNRRAPTKLALALMLRFYALHGRFPKGRHELPDQAVGYVARLVKVSEADLALYEWDGRTSNLFAVGNSCGSAIVGVVLDHANMHWAAAGAVLGVSAALVLLAVGYPRLAPEATAPEAKLKSVAADPGTPAV